MNVEGGWCYICMTNIYKLAFVATFDAKGGEPQVACETIKEAAMLLSH